MGQGRSVASEVYADFDLRDGCGGGSGFGVHATIAGAGGYWHLASRDLKDAEKSKRGVHEEFLVSKDCIAFAVRRKNPIGEDRRSRPTWSGSGPVG